MTIEVVTRQPELPSRDDDGHKGTYGRVLAICGSVGMSGAAVLVGRAALRGGAGLVEVACPRDIQPVVAAGHPCYMTFGFDQLDDLPPRIEHADVLAIGPGLGQSDTWRDRLPSWIAETDKPLVLDADALNNLAPFTQPKRDRPTGPLILTPHPGEFARLTGTRVADVMADREQRAVAFASEFGVVLVLKGHRTLVTDGRRLYRNMTGNSGMATGGSGDVLTGLIAALLGQGLEPFEAAQLGVSLHGTAGDLIAAELGPHSLIATDLIDFLPHAFRQRLA